MKNILHRTMVGLLLSGGIWLVAVGATAPAKPSAATSQAEAPQQSCGYVVMQFDIDEQGRPINIKVIESEPAGRYSEQAIKAIAQWRYEPSVQQGNTLIQQRRTLRWDFNLPPC